MAKYTLCTVLAARYILKTGFPTGRPRVPSQQASRSQISTMVVTLQRVKNARCSGECKIAGNGTVRVRGWARLEGAVIGRALLMSPPARDSGGLSGGLLWALGQPRSGPGPLFSVAVKRHMGLSEPYELAALKNLHGSCNEPSGTAHVNLLLLDEELLGDLTRDPPESFLGRRLFSISVEDDVGGKSGLMVCRLF